jgi:protein-S-isoprenylcysteine O-methyltransferase Ste14
MRATERFVLLCWLVFVVFWAISALSTKPTQERQPLPSRLVTLFFFALAIMLFNGSFHWVPLQRRVLPQLPVVDLLADVLVFLGLLIALWARVTFGRRSFHLAANPTAGGLVTTGPHRFIRHPIYTAVCLLTGTGVLAHGSWKALLLGGMVFAGALVRLFCEEALVVKRYPEYRQYSANTWRMIPFLF